MAESIGKKLTRVRKPRVHITFDVETEGGTVKKELPFVVGVMGDFSGNPTEPLKPLKDRSFVQVDRDNFDAVLARMTPGLNLKVENTLAGDGTEMAVQLQFKKMEDFEPVNVAKQVQPLQKLLEARERLKTLLNDMDRGKFSEEALEEILKNTENLQKAAKELGIASEEKGGQE
ncbi:MAG: type VI secretion system contractile sheath small subunit [Planctomycetes bacterium]|nr:type VI secretion system contractile sheath small subunit [Planctomycetota bacterium]